ncbi:hypothetical protein, partial [Tenacibaculum ovolyticum]|uniref:hypothetical protein n=1 Tax=Tenacibaculum ovolyticum TaxID=104270 RepID=UPI000A60268E
EYMQSHDKLELSILQFGEKWQLNILMNFRNRLAIFLNRKEIAKIKKVELEREENIIRVLDLKLNPWLNRFLEKEEGLDINFKEKVTAISVLQISKLIDVITKKIYTE